MRISHGDHVKHKTAMYENMLGGGGASRAISLSNQGTSVDCYDTIYVVCLELYTFSSLTYLLTCTSGDTTTDNDSDLSVDTLSK